jgi:hypothetical protein
MNVVTLRDESLLQGDFYVPRFEIRIEGVGLPRNVLRDVMQLTYKDNIKEIDGFELTVNNWDPDTQDFKYVGSETAERLARQTGDDRLFEKPAEYEAATAGGPAVEAEGELLQVGLQVIWSDGALVCAENPPLEQAGDPVHGGHDHVGGIV